MGKIVNTASTLANLILFFGGVFGLGILAYLIYFYSWTGNRLFTNWLGPVLYYGVPLLLSIVLFAGLKLSPDRKINIALCMVSSGISIYFIEAALTIWLGLPSVATDQLRHARIRAAQSLGLKYDSRTRAQVIDSMRRQHIDAGPSIFAQSLLQSNSKGELHSRIQLNGNETLPLASVANRRTVVCNEDGTFLSYTSDEHGFNNPNYLWHTTPIDIVALGDSFTQGWCVRPADNFVALIRRRYPATLNLGIEGNGPLTMLATLKEYGRIVRPRIVLWFYFEGNDMADLRKEGRSPLLRRYLTPDFSQDLLHRQNAIDRALREYVAKMGNKEPVQRTLSELWEKVRQVDSSTMEAIFKLSQTRRAMGLLRAIDAPVRLAEQVEQSRQRRRSMKVTTDLLRITLVEALKSVAEWNGRMYFVYLPSRTEYDASGDRNPDRESVLEIASSLGLPIVDVYQAFTNQPDPLGLFPLRIGSHYNGKGHQIVADEVLKMLAADMDDSWVSPEWPLAGMVR